VKNKKFDHFPQYLRWNLNFGLTDGPVPDNDNYRIGGYANAYAIQINLNDYEYWLAGKCQRFELPEGVLQPRWEYNSINVFGCGLVMDPENKLCIFFTLDGHLLGEF
jgi:hypothetical protein